MARLFIGMPNGLAILRQQNGSWQASRQLEGLSVQAIAVDPLHPLRLYCGTWGRGMWRSEDGGTQWQPAAAELGSVQFMAVAVSRTERTGGRGVAYAGTEPTALYRSEDGGTTWEELPDLLRLPSAPTWSFPPRPHTSHVRAIAPDPNAEGHLYVAIEAGALVRSYDGGQTWEDRKPGGPYDSHTLALPAAAPGTIYSAAGDGFFVSRDGGDTWEQAMDGSQHHYCWSVAVDPANPETLILSAARGPMQAHTPSAAASAVYRRSGGEPWQRISDGLPEENGMLAAALAASETEPGVFYAASNLGVLQSADSGQTWLQLAVDWPDEYRGMRPQALVAV
jgi:photosystem II stability/assembly factor-like uncharacterized protein